MLSLESHRWSELQHAYGTAQNIPAYLQQLKDFPREDSQKEPWETLWSSLAHQGDVYSASFAAVPHVVSVIASAPDKVSFSYFSFPACVEIGRINKNVEIPNDLRASYFDALAQLPVLVGAASNRKWDTSFLLVALAAIAAAKGQTTIAEAVLELTPEVAKKFLDMFFSGSFE